MISATGSPTVLCILLATLLTAQANAQPPAPRADATASSAARHDLAQIAFDDVTRAAGITFEQQSAPEKKYILESMSGGVALVDVDNDGRLDLYLVNSLTVATATEPRSAPSALYRNLGGGRFEDISESAGVAYPGWGVGACAADYDGDGRRDLYITGVGRNVLYRNVSDPRADGHGIRFEDVSETMGVTAGGWSAGCAFADIDRDGDLDLFVSRYVEIDLENLPTFGQGKTCQYRGIAVQCGPRGLPGTPDLLYRNDGDRFTDIAKAAGVDDPTGHFGLGLAFFDANGDTWPDLYVANDANANFLYINQRDGTFQDDAFPLGVAVSEDGSEQGGMGVAVGDIEGDGRFGVLVTNFSEEYNAYYQAVDDYFVDVSFRAGFGAPSLPYVGWGTAFFDLDNDADLDSVVVNGHVYPQLDQARLGASAPYRQRKLVHLGDGDGRFEEVGEALGPLFTTPRVSRGLAVGDLDNDGRLDLVINDLDGPAQVLMNRHRAPGHWLGIALEGASPNRDAIGAVVTVTTRTAEPAKSSDTPSADAPPSSSAETTRRQSRLVQSGASYLSQHDLRLHFGLGDAQAVESVEVLWPDGRRTIHRDVVIDRYVTIRQDEPAPSR
ncbi:MAG: CRTAC1 family protein [Acidobacteriota bacterium]